MWDDSYGDRCGVTGMGIDVEVTVMGIGVG